MKKYFFLSAVMMLGVMLPAQVLTQKGVSYRYNGKNPRTPLSNVAIECATANNTVISDTEGSFTLVFNKLKMGDRVGTVTVKKREMMVFNQQTVDEWSIRKEPLCLILCDANEFEHQKQELINIGKREAKAKYDRQKHELEKQLEACQIDRAKFEAELDKAWDELDRLHKHIDEYADLFARIDQSEIDTLAQQAMDLFNKGHVDEAVGLFEQGNYLEKLKQDNRAIEQAEQLIEATEQAKAKAKEEKELHLNSLKAQVEAYKMQNEWKKAGALLKGLADELNDWESAKEYSHFCSFQNLNDEDLKYCKIALDRFYSSPEGCTPNSLGYYWVLSDLIHRAACAFQKCDMLQEACKYYQFSIDIMKQIAEYENSCEFSVAWYLNNLGSLYMDIHEHEKAKESFRESLVISQKLCSDPNATDIVYQLYGNCLSNMGDAMLNDSIDTALVFYERSLDIRMRFIERNEPVYVLDVAKSLRGIAQAYFIKKDYNNSELFYTQSLQLIRDLYKSNPQAYEPELVITLYKIGRLRVKQEQYLLAISVFEEALTILRRLASNNHSFFVDYHGSLYWLSQLYPMTSEHVRHYEINEEWLPLVKADYINDTEAYQKHYVNALGNQSFQCVFVGQIEKAEQYSREALSIDSTQHWIYTNLAAALLFQGKYSEAEAIYRQYKDELKDSFIQDLNDFETAGVIPEERKADVERIRRMLMED